MPMQPKMFASKLLHLSTLLLLVITSRIELTSAQSSQCQLTESFFCNIVNVTYRTFAPFRNNFGHETLHDARSALHKYAFLLSIPECEKKVQLFLCSLYFPNCPDRIDNTELSTDYLLPCKDICEEAYQCEPHIRKAMNYSWPEKWNCKNFQYYENNKLCVKNTQKETVIHIDPPEPPVAPLHSEPTKHSLSPTNQTHESACDPGFFDCLSGDPTRPICIQQKFVCDGNPDCEQMTSESESKGLSRDEADCGNRCEDERLFCDSRCISRSDICNGITDCSSNIDEQDCPDGSTKIAQPMQYIFVLMAAVWCYMIGWCLRHFWCFRHLWCLRDNEDKDQAYDTIHNQDNSANHQELCIEDKVQSIIAQKTYPRLPPVIYPPEPTLVQSQYGEPSIHSCHESYEASSVIVDRSDYDRIIPGGYSGASSIYDSNYHQMNSQPLELKPTPPAPPPTPALDRPNFYENLDEMKDTDSQMHVMIH